MNQDYRHRIRTNKNLFRIAGVAAAVLGVLLVVALGFYWGRQVGREGPTLPAKPGDSSRVVVFLAFPHGDEFEMIAREVLQDSAPLTMGREILDELLAGPGTEDLGRVVSEKAELRAFYIDDAGIAYIDLDRQALGIARDALDEYMAIQSFFESLRRNIPGINGVKFLIDSKEVDSLWGHFDASLPWTAEYEAP